MRHSARATAEYAPAVSPGVKELVYQIRFDSDVSRQHMSDEAIGELVFSMKHATHLLFLNQEHGGCCNRGRSRYANGLSGEAAFPKKVARPQNRHHHFFACSD